MISGRIVFPEMEITCKCPKAGVYQEHLRNSKKSRIAETQCSVERQSQNITGERSHRPQKIYKDFAFTLSRWEILESFEQQRKTIRHFFYQYQSGCCVRMDIG